MTLDRVTACLAIGAALLGLAHIGITFAIYSAWDLEALWFLGSGIAIVIGALANSLTLDNSGWDKRLVLTFINIVMTAFFLSAWLLLPAPQVAVGGCLFVALLVCSGLRHLPILTQFP